MLKKIIIKISNSFKRILSVLIDQNNLHYLQLLVLRPHQVDSHNKSPDFQNHDNHNRNHQHHHLLSDCWNNHHYHYDNHHYHYDFHRHNNFVLAGEEVEVVILKKKEIVCDHNSMYSTLKKSDGHKHKTKPTLNARTIAAP